jgi:hypothetical protein
MPTTNYVKVLAALKKRQALEQQVQIIQELYQPRIDKLVATIAKRTSKKTTKIRTLTTDIQCRRFKLNGGELSRLRQLFPQTKDL